MPLKAEKPSLNLSDQQLLKLIRDDNTMAFNCIYTKYWKRLLIYTTKILNDQSLAEDVLQDVFTKLWLKRQELNINNLESYLFVAVKHKSISLFRKIKFTQLDEKIIENLMPHNVETDAHIISNELEESVLKSMKKLPKRCRDIFYLSKFKNYSNEEIAQHYKISRRTVENQLYIAVKQLRLNLSKVISVIFFFF